MESLSLRFISLLSLCIVFSISRHVVALRTYYVEDRCTPSTSPVSSIDYEVGSSIIGGGSSSGILKSSANGGYRAGLNCKLRLKKWGSGGIILTIQKIDFRTSWPDCLTIVNSYGTELAALCGSQTLWDESKSYYSDGDFTLYYKTSHQTFDASSLYAGFQVMYTGYTNPSCGSEQFLCDNYRCIWSGLVCNGHNNCGDRSDERCVGSMTVGAFVGLIIGIFLLICFAIGVRIFYVRRRRKNVPGRVLSPPGVVPSYVISYHSPGTSIPPPQERDLPPDYNAVGIIHQAGTIQTGSEKQNK